MAKKVTGFIKLQVPAGAANPAPPVGPALGQHGVNIMEFCKQFNARTQGQPGMIIPVEITVFTRDAEDTLRRHGVEHAVAVREFLRDDVLPALQPLDLFILGGGGILFGGEVPIYFREVELAHELNVPVMIYGVSAGPLDDPRSQAQVVRCFEIAEAATVRDRRAKNLLAFFGALSATAITTAHIREYQRHRRDAQAAAATVNRETAALKKMFRLAIAIGRDNVYTIPEFYPPSAEQDPMGLPPDGKNFGHAFAHLVLGAVLIPIVGFILSSIVLLVTRGAPQRAKASR